MRRLVILTLLLPLALVACSRGGNEQAPSQVKAWTGEPPISAPWLRDRPPGGMLAYIRVPYPLAIIASPKGNIFDTMLGSDANVRNFENIRQGLAENLTQVSPIFSDPRFTALISDLNSPIEVALVATPMPMALVGATLKLRSAQEFEALFAQLAQMPPYVGLAGPLDDQGFASLSGIPLPVSVMVHFDADTGRLAIFASQTPNQQAFSRLLASPTTTTHAMYALENQIDTSGQGLFAWIDTQQALGLAAMATPPEVQQTLRTSGAGDTSSVAFGMGVANGKGRLKLIADVGTNSQNRMFPVISNSLTATSVGEPRGLVMFSLPSAEEFSRVESLILAKLPPGVSDMWNNAKQRLTDTVGMSIESVLSAIGPELLAISDGAGSYSALRVRDRAAFDKLLDGIASATGATIQDREVEGRTIRYVDMPNSLGALEDASLNMEGPLSLLSRLKSHVYWMADGDYVYTAEIPQLLIDRTREGANTSIADWLANTQRVDVSSSLLAATGTIERLPRTMYQLYLRGMQTVADIVDVDYDIWSMPTSDQLGLPDRGTLGLSLNLGQPYVSFELTYESNPVEALLGGGAMPAVAVAGIVAAIAVPQYQNYAVRAQVVEGLNLAAAAKTAVVEYYDANGGSPDDRAQAGMSANATDTQGKYVSSVQIDHGSIIVTYGNQANAQLQGKTLILTPYESADKSVIWRCGAAAAPSGRALMGTAAGDPAEDFGGGSLVITGVQYLPSLCR